MINFYVPSEYEAMLLAAGWITLEDIDDNYIEYRKRGSMDYHAWKQATEKYEELNEIFYKVIVPHIREDKPLPAHIETWSKNLEEKMSEIETILGY